MAEGLVITGLGAVTGLGLRHEALFGGLVERRSAIRSLVGRVEGWDPSGFSSDLGGWIDGLDAKAVVPKHYRKAVKVMARDTQIAVMASAVAAEDAGLVTRWGGESPTTYPSERVGCHIGAGLIAAEADELAEAMATAPGEDGSLDLRAWGEGAMENLPPLWLLKYLPNMLACHVTILHGCTGPSNTITFGEASGLLSIGESMRVIERGDADACFTGSAESKLNPMGMIRLEHTGRIAPVVGGDPSERESDNPIRPYDPRSPGQLLGEGGGILVIEREATARARGARSVARLVGFGAAHSPGGLDMMRLPALGRAGALREFERNDGLVDAIGRALRDAGLNADDIDAVVPHASGVPFLDRLEGGALREVFGGRDVPIVTWVPNVGECMAGNGGIQAVVASMCLREQRLPGRIFGGSGAESGSRERMGDMLAGPSASCEAELEHVLVCSSSLGGANAALVLRAAH